MAEHIYKDANNQRLPSVTTIISRFKDSGGLLHWANSEGLKGKTLQEARVPAATAGTLAHDLVEAHVHKLREPDLSREPDEIVGKARRAYNAYLSWASMVKINVLHTEVPLVSEKYRFGGRLDGVGIVAGMNKGLALIDWKTSNAIYADMALQLAAYKILWEETYPENPIVGGFHLCRFAKEEGDFAHHYFPDLTKEGECFLKMRELYDLVKAVEKRVK